MLDRIDQLRAGFAPHDVVHFNCRRKKVEGTIIRTNPKRAVVRVGEKDYTVPYERLVPSAGTEAPRAERMAGVLTLATGLMQLHGLGKWTFRFDHSTRRAGCCNFRDQIISISFELARNAPEEEIRDTLLHEIAHALVGRKHHHDAVWRAKAQAIGGSGERCHRLQFTTPRYRVTCENQCWSQPAERRNRRLVCRTCGGKLVYSPFGQQA